MAKKRSTRPGPKAKPQPVARAAVTAERAARLHRLLQLLSTGPKTRSVLIRRLRLDQRGFYRDLELLRDAGIVVPLEKSRYSLEKEVEVAVARLPFPDPLLTLGEAQQLAKGHTRAHQKLKAQIKQIVK